ncbi:Plasmid replication initiator protein TrfA [Pandoraea horticolens]|uniref:Plasmid replication initiator protein TrfA n=1 Tax=Pandoraea horticolens TaxID=2508298 RepID=A0A5E4Y574_9BURK|nr:plasmid replication initiator TrfA [Pandoraea horticolens]VVE43869.1 Plasmid replication initiator protein TrfA [Pandoraea horticolens]
MSTLDALIEKLRPRAELGQARAHDVTNLGGQLPLFPEEDASAIPNYIARTPLFAPIPRGRRKMHDDALLPSPDGFEVRFSGKQFDMGDQDVFMLALRYAQGVDLNQPVKCERAQFLRDLGWVPGRNGAFGKSAYAWLDESFKRLTTGTLHIRTKRYTANLSLIAEWTQDNQTGMWEFTIGARVRVLFSNNEYAFVDVAKRKLIEHRVDLAKWLQSYASTHAPGIPHRVSIESLKRLCGYTSPTRKFREALSEALCELERLKILVDARPYRDGAMVQWTRFSPVGQATA